MLAFLIGPAALRAESGDADVLASLRKGHPRLLVLDDDIVRVKQAIATDAMAKSLFDQLKAVGDKAIADPVSSAS